MSLNLGHSPPPPQKEVQRLRVFQNIVLRRIFGPKREEVGGKENAITRIFIHNWYCSPNISRVAKSRRII
jgi:hypothetical protein